MIGSQPSSQDKGAVRFCCKDLSERFGGFVAYELVRDPACTVDHAIDLSKALIQNVDEASELSLGTNVNRMILRQTAKLAKSMECLDFFATGYCAFIDGLATHKHQVYSGSGQAFGSQRGDTACSTCQQDD